MTVEKTIKTDEDKISEENSLLTTDSNDSCCFKTENSESERTPSPKSRIRAKQIGLFSNLAAEQPTPLSSGIDLKAQDTILETVNTEPEDKKSVSAMERQALYFIKRN